MFISSSYIRPILVLISSVRPCIRVLLLETFPEKCRRTSKICCPSPKSRQRTSDRSESRFSNKPTLSKQTRLKHTCFRCSRQCSSMSLMLSSDERTLMNSSRTTGTLSGRSSRRFKATSDSDFHESLLANAEIIRRMGSRMKENLK